MIARFIGAAAAATCAVSVVVAAPATPQQAFVQKWERQRVLVKQTLYSLVYNERPRLGPMRNGLRDGLTVVTPSEGVYFLFEGRQAREDVRERRVEQMIESVNTNYIGDSLEVRKARKVEPLSIERYSPGFPLVVRGVRIERDTVRLLFARDEGSAIEDAVTSLTVKWPLPFSKPFTESENIEQLILQFVEIHR